MSALLKNFTGLLFLALLFSSCSFEDVEVEDITDFKILSVENKMLEYEMKVKVKNPNRQSFTLTAADIDLYLSGVEMGKTRLMENVKVKSNRTKVVTVRLQTELNKPLKDFAGSLLGTMLTGRLNLELKGQVRGRCCLVVSKKFDVDHKEAVPIKDLLF